MASAKSSNGNRSSCFKQMLGTPLVNTETDNREVVVWRPYSGVDDGVYSNGNNGGAKNKSFDDESGDPDVELIPTLTKEPEDIVRDTARFSPDVGSINRDDKTPATQLPTSQPLTFSQTPEFAPYSWDPEVGSTLASGETIPDLNVYQHKKTLAQGMMDLALFSANANQLRYVLEKSKNHPYYYSSMVLISLSLVLQVFVGVGLIWNATYNVKEHKALFRANRVNNSTTICIFFVTVVNVFISAFDVAS